MIRWFKRWRALRKLRNAGRHIARQPTDASNDRERLKRVNATIDALEIIQFAVREV